jgi:hypothetical protein
VNSVERSVEPSRRPLVTATTTPRPMIFHFRCAPKTAIEVGLTVPGCRSRQDMLLIALAVILIRQPVARPRHESQVGNPEPVPEGAISGSVDVILLVVVALVALKDAVFARFRMLK